MSSYWYFKDRKSADKMTWFIVIMLVIGVLLGLAFPNSNQKSNGKNMINKESKDSVVIKKIE